MVGTDLRRLSYWLSWQQGGALFFVTQKSQKLLSLKARAVVNKSFRKKRPFCDFCDFCVTLLVAGDNPLSVLSVISVRHYSSMIA
jgi:hypothetical protein